VAAGEPPGLPDILEDVDQETSCGFSAALGIFGIMPAAEQDWLWSVTETLSIGW
jgi:hypothetical protein